MIDYLEEACGEGTEALQEEVRQAFCVGRADGAEDAETGRALTEALGTAPGEWERQEQRQERERVPKVMRDRMAFAEWNDRAEGGQGGLPLLQAVRQLERMENGRGAGRSRTMEWSPEGRRRWKTNADGRSSFREWSGREMTPTMGRHQEPEEALQADRVDRAFRRDSRRYDGGFFLY